MAKSELVRALPDAAAGGVAVLNADDPLVAAMAAVTAARVVTVGQDAGADVRAEDVRLDEQGRPSYVLHTAHGEPVPVRLPLHGAPPRGQLAGRGSRRARARARADRGGGRARPGQPDAAAGGWR